MALATLRGGLFVGAACVGVSACRGCVPSGSAPLQDAGLAAGEEVGDRALEPDGFRRVDLGVLSLRVPESWRRAEWADAGWSLVRFEAPFQTMAAIEISRRRFGEPWNEIVTEYVDAGWSVVDASIEERATFSGTFPGKMTHELTRLVPSGGFLVEIGCQ